MSSFYQGVVQGEPLQQGDILPAFPFPTLRLGQIGLISDGELTQWRYGTDLHPLQEATLLAARFRVLPVLILTQTCDLQPRPEKSGREAPVVFAAVTPAEETLPRFGEPKKMAEELKMLSRAGERNQFFYLPPFRIAGEDFGHSLVSFYNVITGYHELDLQSLAGMPRVRLSAYALALLQDRLRNCFGRIALPDGFLTSASAVPPGAETSSGDLASGD